MNSISKIAWNAYIEISNMRQGVDTERLQRLGVDTKSSGPALVDNSAVIVDISAAALALSRQGESK